MDISEWKARAVAALQHLPYSDPRWKDVGDALLCVWESLRLDDAVLDRIESLATDVNLQRNPAVFTVTGPISPQKVAEIRAEWDRINAGKPRPVLTLPPGGGGRSEVDLLEALSTRIPFGKFTGKTLEFVGKNEPAYLDFLAGMDDLKDSDDCERFRLGLAIPHVCKYYEKEIDDAIDRHFDPNPGGD